jgi:hypothetical protein
MIQSVDLTLTLRHLCARPCSLRSGARARDEAIGMIEREALVMPAFGYRILPVQTVRGDAIDVGDAALDAPVLAAEIGRLKAVAAAACTLGSAIQERVSALFAMRRRSLALALDTVANELLFRLADRASAAIGREARRTGLCAGIEASPGDPGMPITQQAGVLALADAARIGIHTAGAGMLWPMKSLSFLVALGPTRRRRSAPARCNCCPSRDRCAAK